MQDRKDDDLPQTLANLMRAMPALPEKGLDSDQDLWPDEWKKWASDVAEPFLERGATTWSLPED